MIESTVGWIDTREKYYLLAKKIWLISLTIPNEEGAWTGICLKRIGDQLPAVVCSDNPCWTRIQRSAQTL